MNKPANKSGTANVLQLRKTRPGVELPEGWRANSKYGFLRRETEGASELVRLEDVAIWLSEKLPRKNVIHELFFELITYSGADADFLYILNSQQFAKPLIVGGKVSNKTDSWWQFFPAIDRGDDKELVARCIADAWERVWAGLANPELDHEWKVKRTIARNRERSAMAAANREGRDYFGEYWPEDDFLLGLLCALAIPVAKAYELWGYGRLAGTTPEVPALATPEPQGKLVIPWTSERRAKLLADFDATLGKGVGERQAIVAEKWITGLDNVKKYLRQAKKEAKASKPGSHWKGLEK